LIRLILTSSSSNASTRAEWLFVREGLVRAHGLQLIVTDCFAAYVEYASERGWVALSRNKFGQVIGDVVARQHGMTVRHDIPDAKGKEQRGWSGLALGRNITPPILLKAAEVGVDKSLLLRGQPNTITQHVNYENLTITLQRVIAEITASDSVE
jgi:hypothetical protein